MNSRWPPELPSGTAGQLHAVGCIKDDRTAQRPHHRKRTHIHHQVVVAETCSPFGQQYPVAPGCPTLSTAYFMSQGETNWPFLIFTALAGLGRRDQQVCLAAEKGRDLENIEHFGGPFNLGHVMHIGDHRQHRFPPGYEQAAAVPFRCPGPRKESSDVRLALSKEALNT